MSLAASAPQRVSRPDAAASARSARLSPAPRRQRPNRSVVVVGAKSDDIDVDDDNKKGRPSSTTSTTSTTTQTPPQKLQQQQQQQKEPFEYKDTLTDVAFIALCRLSYGRLAGGYQSPEGWLDGASTYRGMVDVSRALMKKLPRASEQSAAVIKGFPKVAPWFRKLFPYSSWGAEANARITPAFFSWLVGPAKVREEKVVDFRGNEVRSAVKIERCRYLAESRCVGMCVNLCRTPVQSFFAEEMGVPLRITPNFEDFSCVFEFGVEAVSEEEDDVVKVGCLSTCPSSPAGDAGPGAGKRCPKLEG